MFRWFIQRPVGCLTSVNQSRGGTKIVETGLILPVYLVATINVFFREPSYKTHSGREPLIRTGPVLVFRVILLTPLKGIKI